MCGLASDGIMTNCRWWFWSSIAINATVDYKLISILHEGLNSIGLFSYLIPCIFIIDSSLFFILSHVMPYTTISILVINARNFEPVLQAKGSAKWLWYTPHSRPAMQCIILVRNRIKVLPMAFRRKDIVCVRSKDAVCIRLSATYCRCIIMRKHLKFLCVFYSFI